MSAPVVWFASPNGDATPSKSEYQRTALGPKEALEMLRDADRTMIGRLENLRNRKLLTWPGYELRVYVEDGGVLLASHRDVHPLMLHLTRHGLRARVRLEVHW